MSSTQASPALASHIARSHVLMFLTTVLIATTFPIGAAITNELDTLVLTFLRFALAALLFAPIIAWRYGLHVPGFRDVLRYALLSACLVAFFWGMFTALRYTSALNSAAIFTMAPVISALVSAMLLKEKLSTAARIALPIGMCGAIWVIFKGDLDAFLMMKLGMGDAIFFAATIVMGFYGPLVKHLHRGEPMAQMTFWTLVTGAIWLLMLAAPNFSSVQWAVVPISVYIGIIYLAIFATLISFFTIQWCTTVIGPTKTISYTYLNPIMVTFITMALGNPSPPISIYPGFALIITAIYVLQRN